MDNMTIDLETYSGTDLSRCGVYRYAEDKDFEILLFGYSVDFGDAKVIDLRRGEKIPGEIIEPSKATRSSNGRITRFSNVSAFPVFWGFP